MAWETRRNGRRYYYSATRIGGRVVKAYLGSGEIAAQAERLAALGHQRNDADQAERTHQRLEAARLEPEMTALASLAAALTGLALHDAGYHRHHRGDWRKRRHG